MAATFVTRTLLAVLISSVSLNSVAHYCAKLNDEELALLEKTRSKIEIDRTELGGSVFYQIRAPANVSNVEIIGVFLRFGFGAHPEGSVAIAYETENSRYINFGIDSISKGFRGCVVLAYGEDCGIKPQIVVTYDGAFVRMDLENTVYCGFDY